MGFVSHGGTFEVGVIKYMYVCLILTHIIKDINMFT